ncbi:MAG: hypothetical protein DRJ42_24195 [Deltaproteobacteria bacterium]|nr:MAG: hypothetical protein DRJ42_24195 [Deltaproteobacteria bacterium]
MEDLALLLLLIASLTACSDEAVQAPAQNVEVVTTSAAPATVSEPLPDPLPPSIPTWPSAAQRPDARACESAADCVYTNANRGPCCVAQRGVVFARSFVNWRRSWIAGNCPANECVEVLLEPTEPCAGEARCVDGECRDACE